MDLRLTFVDRATYTVKFITNCYNWSLEKDVIASVQSKFTLGGSNVKDLVNVGDFVIAKSIGEWIYPTQPSDRSYEWTKALYIGVIEATENDSVSASQMTNLYNITIPITNYWNGQNPSKFIGTLTNDVLSYDRYLGPIQWADIDNQYRHFSIRQDKLATYNVETVLSNIFKTTQYLTTCIGYKYNVTTRTLEFAMGSYRNLNNFGTLLLSHNSKVMNPSVYVRPENVGNPNAILLSYNNSRSTYYLTEDNRIVTNANDLKIHKPVSKTGYVYISPEHTQKGEIEPTPTEIATRELKVQQYQHEIKFDIKSDYGLLYNLLDLGANITLQYNGIKYQSIITNWSATSTSDFFNITCGNVRSTLQFALDGTYE